MTEMACAASDRPELIEAYLLGDIEEPARESFERHLFTCDKCLAHLRILEAVRTELRAAAPGIRAASVPAVRPQAWTWLAAAASLALVTALAFWRLGTARPPFSSVPGTTAPAASSSPRRPGPSPETILALGWIEPPRYVPLEVRGAESAPAFAGAMRAYAAGDYAAAADGLRRLRRSSAGDVQTDFFLGVALLMSDDAGGAIEPLGSVVARGESPYRQLASLYLGKARLRRGDLDGAEAEWARTAGLPGAHARDAADLLALLRSARRTR